MTLATIFHQDSFVAIGRNPTQSSLSNKNQGGEIYYGTKLGNPEVGCFQAQRDPGG